MSSIREATVEDAERLFDIHVRSTHEGGREHYPRSVLEAWHQGRSAEGMRDAIRDGQFFVLTEGDEACGFAQVDGSELVALFVDPERQGRGFGTSLFRFAESRIDARPLRLDATLNSVSFYIRMGCARRAMRHVERGGRDIYVVEMSKG